MTEEMSFEKGSWGRAGEVVFCEELLRVGTTHVWFLSRPLSGELISVGENIYIQLNNFFFFFLSVPLAERRVYPTG